MTHEMQFRPAIAGALGASLALCMMQDPAHAGGDVSNFNVRNCTSERIFVCSFDKTDSLMKVPYKARGIQPGDRKEFGCVSIGRCKVIIGVSKRKAKQTLSASMKEVIGSSVVVGGFFGGAIIGGIVTTATAEAGMLVGGVAGTAILGVAAGGAIASIEIADGWSDGEVCNQVRKAAQKAGYTPKHFLQDGKTYTVDAQYAVDDKNRAYVNPDGTAVFAYTTKKGNSCPVALEALLVPN